jgi:hypothetical protein
MPCLTHRAAIADGLRKDGGDAGELADGARLWHMVLWTKMLERTEKPVRADRRGSTWPFRSFGAVLIGSGAAALAGCGLASQGDGPACLFDSACGTLADASTIDAVAPGDAAASDATRESDARVRDGAAGTRDGSTSLADSGAGQGMDATSPPAQDAATGSPEAGGEVDASVDVETPDSSTDMDAAPDASDGACSSLVNVGPIVTEVATNPPAPTGMAGTLVDGTYFLTSDTVYGQPTGSGPLQVTIAVHPNDPGDGGVPLSGTIESVENANGQGDVAYVHTFDILFKSAIYTTSTCGPSGSILDTTVMNGFGYTATPDEITLYSSRPAVRVLTFSRQ